MPRKKESEWAKAKARYSTGDYSKEQVGDYLGVSDTAIDNRMAKDKKSGNSWVKGELKAKIEKKVEESTIAMMARLNMPKERVVKEVLIEGLEATNQKWVKNPNYEEGAEGEAGEQWLLVIYADHTSRAKYLDQYNKMTGGFTPIEKKIETEDVTVGNKELKNLSTEELEELVKLVEKAGGEE